MRRDHFHGTLHALCSSRRLLYLLRARSIRPFRAFFNVYVMSRVCRRLPFDIALEVSVKARNPETRYVTCNGVLNLI
jgi:hypothetical protein